MADKETDREETGISEFELGTGERAVDSYRVTSWHFGLDHRRDVPVEPLETDEAADGS
jgi:hypothetical protein